MDWDWESEGYEANFWQNGKKHKAYFDHEGNFQAYEILDIDQKELPIDLSVALKYSKFEMWKMEHITERHRENETFYEIEVKNGNHDEKLYYDKNGSPISKEFYEKGQM